MSNQMTIKQTRNGYITKADKCFSDDEYVHTTLEDMLADVVAYFKRPLPGKKYRVSIEEVEK